MTVAQMGIYLMTVIIVITLGLQIRGIFIRKSVASLSTWWIVYLAAMFMSGIIYGATAGDQEIFLNNIVLAFLHGVVALAILKYRGFRRSETWFTIGLLLSLLLMFISRHNRLSLDRWFLVFFPGGIILTMVQVRAIWTARNVGVVDARLLAAYVLSNVFWTIKALTGDNWTLYVICPANLVASSILLMTWLAFRPQTHNPVLS